jgi:D-alanine transaminase
MAAAPFTTCWLNGAFLSLAEARISPLDRGYLFGDGVYEVVPVHRGRPFRMRQHLDRLERSLAEVSMRNALSRAGWIEVIERLVAEAGQPELLVYMQVTRGAEAGRNHLFPPAETASGGFAFVGPYPVPPAALLDNGLAAVTLPDLRWARCDIKATALLANVLLRQQAQERGGAEALLLRDGYLTEGSSSTVFVVREGRIVTPPNDWRVLPGTTRDAVLERAAGWLPSEIRPITEQELRAGDEIWIASAGRGVLPVTTLDGRPVGTGRPGSVWRELYARWQQHLDAIAGRPALED